LEFTGHMQVGQTRATESDTAVVVVSHDRYADIWSGFFSLLFRFWADNPYPLYLISNQITHPHSRIQPICVGEDLSWSQTLADGLARVPSRVVLLVLDDFYLTGPVDTALVRRLRDAMAHDDVVYLRLAPNPKPDIPLSDISELGLIRKGAPYRASLQMAFWDRLALLDLLRPGESAWDFELRASRRSDAMTQKFLSVREGIRPIPYRDVVIRGKFLPEAIEHFSSLDVGFDLSKRPVESTLILRWQRSAFRLFLGRAWRSLTHRPL
jgi:hypothetical protein